MYACRGPFASVDVFSRDSLPKLHICLLQLLALILCLFLSHGPQSSSCLSVSDFFPFGSSARDRETEHKDDGGSGAINLSVMFPFFGRRHNKIYVNNNGIITFVAELPTYTPDKFPLPTPILAPFWADVDNSNDSGTVWFRETRDRTILAKATQEIRAYSAYRNFRASWVFVATWDDVGFYGARGEGLSKKNTFQSVLTLDVSGLKSFVILNYAVLEWTSGANNQGDIATGLGGDPAQAGFNAGDMKNAHEIDGARTPAVINLTQTSNVGVPGKWIFQIDSAEIQNVCSQFDSGTVTFQPTYASMLGGEAISVDGLCFDSDIPPMKGRLENRDGTIEELCCFVENVSAKCYLPSLFHTGLVNVSLNIDDRGWNYSGQLEIKNIVDVRTDLKRISPGDWIAGRSVTVTWTNVFFEGASNYKIEVLAFKTRSGKSSLESVYSITHTRNDVNIYGLDLPRNFSGASVAVVQVTALPNNCSSHLAGPAIYSDVFPVRFVDTTYSQTFCANWSSQQSKLKLLSAKGHCPCTLSQAEGDTAQYSADPFCNLNSDWSSNCKYRSSLASHCIIPNQISGNGGNFVCCYDKVKGELIMAPEGNGGGTMERYGISQEDPDVVPYFTYMEEEISPYMQCCEFSNNRTLYDLYLAVRPPVDCRGYQPPAAAQAAGDPHLITLDGLSYTFNGFGVYTLLRVKGRETTVQVRTVPAPSETSQNQSATVFSAVAMRASNTSSVFEVRLRSPGEQELVSVFKDSKPFPLSTLTSQLTEMTVHWNITANGTAELTVVMDELGLSVLVQATEDMLNIMVIAGVGLKGKLEGLLGNYNGEKADDLTARDGTMLGQNASMMDIHFIFGMSWNVSGNDSLFTKVADEELQISSDNAAESSTTRQTFSPIFIDNMSSAVFPSDTKEVCGSNQECFFDYVVTGKKSIALATLRFNERYGERLKDVSEVVRCPYVNTDAIENGSRNLTGLQVGASLTVSCDDGFHISGSYDEVTCEGNGEWNTSPPSCVQVVPDEDIPLEVAVGVASGGFLLIVIVVIVIKVIHKKCSRRKAPKSIGSEIEAGTELPIIFTISDIPSPVFENSLFISSLLKLSEKGSFHIPRPTFVDPNIYKDFF